jgi:site-specific recombinase XerD
MRLATLHARFLQHCAVAKRLRPMTIKSYRSDFGLFLQFLRRRRRFQTTLSSSVRGQGEGPGLRSLTPAVIRDYQAHMATRRWSVNTVRRRLVELNRFAGWLVERRYLHHRVVGRESSQVRREVCVSPEGRPARRPETLMSSSRSGQ